MCPAPWNNDPMPAHFQDGVTGLAADSHMAGKAAAVNGTVPMRPHPVSHLSVDAPLCPECAALDLNFFDPGCAGCRGALSAPGATVAHVFAALRQWVPQVQRRADFLVAEALRMGAHPDDRDSLTDMTLLMYACKAGAGGVGDARTAADVASGLIALGADTSLRCKWTDMAALHYAAYFDVAPAIDKLLMKSKGVDVDTACAEYEDGTALHIAASNLSCEAARTLLAFGADTDIKDSLARTPVDCIPDPEDFGPIPDTEELIDKMEKILSKKYRNRSNHQEDMSENDDDVASNNNYKKAGSSGGSAVSGRTVLKALGLQVGDRVLVNNGTKLGTLRFCGTAEFAAGVWAGVELDSPEGKNNGTVKGVVYFRCKDFHGVFVPAGKVARVGKNYREEFKPAPRANVVNRGKVDTSGVSSRLTDCLAVIEDKQEIKAGDRVLVREVVASSTATARPRREQAARGTVRFIGEVDFVRDDNRWFGVELDQPVGKHDGTVQGVRYFAAAPNCGIFVTEAKVEKLTGGGGTQQQQQITVAQAKKQGSRSQQSLSSQHQRKAGQGVGLRRSVSVKNTSSTAATPKRPSVGAPPAGHSGDVSSSRPQSAASNSARSRRTPEDQAKEEGWQTVSVEHFNKFKKKVPKKYLEVGTSVICVHNKEMGVVKFVGRVDFAPGIWAGLELRDGPRANRHDGCVKGRRYFTCRAGHGVVLRPKMLSVHGINGEKLLKPESEYPF